ncbi:MULTISPECIES: hypothetical protein [Bacillales]|uniref:hypothetical protein n=1 Tax=Bacillales TaxID=1385 RepID=UPI001909B36C|nr:MULTISPECIES: hypothetical protein [Bacillales]WAI29934.1 MAG: hypothetical protein NRZ50_30345 [Bacillus paranthracis]MBK3312542.1 hypothetical protein [Staphylococcus aureus]WAI35751.1 MAG: hypothetical protein NRZ52_30265 [Bacillus paranthracis]WAI41578.1 MAG: hypothetical protein NRZ51_30710 [Bacillus paranthracis]BCD15145.1 hypothetical protein BC30075_p169 [Bacillus cereus]
MNLVRCVKCNTPVLSTDSMQERLMEEKNELVKKKDNIQAKINKLKQRGAHESTYKRMKMDNHLLGIKIGEVNSYLKLLKHQERETDVNKIMIDILMDELKKHGYKKEFFVQANKTANEIKNERQKQYKNTKNDIYNKVKHNDWHNSKGQYDPTAKMAIDKTMKI